MAPETLADVERTDEVDEAMAALRGHRLRDWVRPYSANGKHTVTVRRDPGHTETT